MGISRKSHGKKTDKETQSPVLKIFKDIMQKETDPEKITLLKDKNRDKKRKPYSGSRSKSDQVSYESSSTDRYKTNRKTKITVQDIQEDRNESFSQNKSKSGVNPFEGEEKDSWWFWDNKKHEKKRAEDTCSCVSCALKKIVGSEYICVACLFILFSVSIAIIFLTVFKTMVDDNTILSKADYDESLVNKIKMVKEKRQLTEGYGWSYTEKNNWDDSNLGRLSGILESDDAGGEVKRSNFPGDIGSISGDLGNVLASEKIIDGKNSERLRDFFQKLIETDAQIRKLKQSISSNYLTDDIKTITDRFKRSIYNKHKYRNRKLEALKHKRSDVHFKANKTENKISLNDTQVTGIVIQEEKIVVQYEPERKRNFPKCSHEHDTKSHEKKLKHPFYKNSQRFDELLNSYKKSEKENLNNIFMQKKVNDKNKDLDVTEKVNRDYNVIYDSTEEKFSTQQTETTKSKSDNDFLFDMFFSTTPVYDVALSVSTFMTVGVTNLKRKNPPNAGVGNRRLLQVDEEEDKEDLVYEDLNEILTDEGQSHDDLDRPNRNKRSYKQSRNDAIDKSPEFYVHTNIHNPNWKGPMPLYPDELNAMIKQAALQNLNQNPIPVNTKDTKSEKDRDEKRISDTEYIEDYVDNKFNKMVKMAQAYSDYGVLYEKKDNIENLKNENKNIEKLKPIHSDSLLSRFFGRPKKGSGEGIKFVAKPGEPPNNKKEFMQSVQKHIKIVDYPPRCHGMKHCGKLRTMNFMREIYTTTDNVPTSYLANKKSIKNMNNEQNTFFGIRKGSRSLKSIEMNEDKANQNDNYTINIFTNKSNDKPIVNTTDGMISFLSMISDWFNVLSVASGEDNIDGFKNIFEAGHQISKYNATKKDGNNTNNINYPSFDSDMVDNIGHRSRLLLSIEDKPSDSGDLNNLSKQEKRSDSTEPNSIVPIALVLASNDKTSDRKERDENIHNEQKNDKNKTIVKRNANDKLVFWNDIYDYDEYGVKIDYLDSVRDKHSAKNGNIIQKSNDWFRNRFKNLTHKIRNRFNKSSTTGKTSLKPCNSSEKVKSKTRSIRQTDNDERMNVKKNFATLTANMKKVCQQAAEAVKKIKNKEVGDETKDDATTSLMQQLVRLMSDLVDIQVQQKTCAKLPPDLHNFLEWLTVPVDNNIEVENLETDLPKYNFEDSLIRFEKSTDPSFDLITVSEDTHEDDRTECLGTIRAIQDLIQQYEGMSDEDKSKMTGVKDYLENQLQFLNKKLNSIDEANLYKIYDKRNAPRNKRDSQTRRNARKINKFVKNFVKKRTKSTTHTYNEVTITKAKKNLNISGGNKFIEKIDKSNEKADNVKVKIKLP